MAQPASPALARVEQFQRLLAQDPSNDMAHFSLAGALRDAGRPADAAESYLRCAELNPAMSKALQLAGECLIDAGQRERAIDVLRTGHATAHARGDTMPRKAIEQLLLSLGQEIPANDAPATTAAASASPGFIDAKTGRPGTRMTKPPFRGPVGAWIGERLSVESWNEWIGLGTKIINELRLDLSKDADSAVYDYGMRRFVGLSDERYRELTGREPEQPESRYREVLDDILRRGGHLEQFKGELHRGV